MTEHDGVDLFATEANRAQGPGAHLRTIREAKRISLEEMAKQLRFTPQRLAQLENDDYSTMGSSTFARGYLRSYGRTLGMPEAEVTQTVALFESQDLQTGILSNKPQLIHEKMAHSNHKVMRSFGLLIILVLVILAGFWWHNRNSADKAEPMQPAGAQQDATGVNPPEGDERQIPLQAAPMTSTPVTPVAAQQQPQVTAEPPAATPAPAPKENPRAGRRTRGNTVSSYPNE